MLKNEKIKVSELQLSFRCHEGRPYYFLRYKKVEEDFYHVGYSSYDMDKVLEWEQECFEIVEKKITNADRIRNMSDEELLDFLCSIETYEEGSVMTIENGVAMCSVTEIEEWLQSEAE